jgi:peptidoglycan/xylan/chitin deacetylase (PgdA/CDA1 family)
VDVTGIETVRVRSVGGRAQARWAEGRTVALPSALLDRAGWRRFIDAVGDLSLPADAPPALDTDVVDLRERAAFTDRPPASSRLPVSYQYVPGWARAIVASSLGRWNRARSDRWARFPSWPLDLSADFVADMTIAAPSQAPGARTPVLLTHDIDSPEGLTRLVSDFLPIEESVGARSTSYVVPCAWPIDHALASAVVARGHDLGVHGYDHSNRTAFADAAERRRRLDGAAALVERYRMVGYRAPSLLRTRALLRDVGVRYRYDSSIPTSGGLFPVPNNGCATARPFIVEGTPELPLTLPRDGSLRFLGHSPVEIAKLWMACADTVARARGVVVLLTHCERRFSGNAPMLAAYRTLLEHIARASDRFEFSTPLRAIDSAGHRHNGRVGAD